MHMHNEIFLFLLQLFELKRVYDGTRRNVQLSIDLLMCIFEQFECQQANVPMHRHSKWNINHIYKAMMCVLFFYIIRYNIFK